MSTRRIVLGFALAALLISQPGHGAAREWIVKLGFILPDASCPQAAHVLTPCPCEVPVITDHLFSTKVDLNRYAGDFVSIKALVAPGTCQPDLLDVRKVDVQPNLPPCPCPASP